MAPANGVRPGEGDNVSGVEALEAEAREEGGGVAGWGWEVC